VIKINNFTLVDLKGKKVMLLKDPLQILKENLEDPLGSANDIMKVIDNQNSFKLD